MKIHGCVPCKSNKERKLLFKKLKNEIGSKPDCEIWYDKNLILYEYQSTRKEIFI